jgi:small GTP-binding protein
MISRKIVLIGDFATGKTSLIRRFVDDQFSDTYLSTIGVKISKKMITLPSEIVQGIIWDIEGGTPTKPVNTTYFIGAHGCILVADITRDETLLHIEEYIKLVREKVSSIPLILVLNKCDMMEEKDQQDMLQLAKERYSADVEVFFLTSAKTGEGVEQMFHMLAKKMLG